MTTREKLHQAIDKAPDESLEPILLFIESLTRPPVTERNGEHVLEYLMRIRMDGPPDLSENLDLYASGEKRIEAPGTLRVDDERNTEE